MILRAIILDVAKFPNSLQQIPPPLLPQPQRLPQPWFVHLRQIFQRNPFMFRCEKLSKHKLPIQAFLALCLAFHVEIDGDRMELVERAITRGGERGGLVVEVQDLEGAGVDAVAAGV